MGFAISDFWDCTIKEFILITEGYAERKEAEKNMMLTHAYAVSRWVWAKKLNLEDIIKTKESKKEMTDKDMMEMCIALNKMFGGNVIDNKKKTTN